MGGVSFNGGKESKKDYGGGGGGGGCGVFCSFYSSLAPRL